MGLVRARDFSVSYGGRTEVVVEHCRKIVFFNFNTVDQEEQLADKFVLVIDTMANDVLGEVIWCYYITTDVYAYVNVYELNFTSFN